MIETNWNWCRNCVNNPFCFPIVIVNVFHKNKHKLITFNHKCSKYLATDVSLTVYEWVCLYYRVIQCMYLCTLNKELITISYMEIIIIIISPSMFTCHWLQYIYCLSMDVLLHWIINIIETQRLLTSVRINIYNYITVL